MISSMNAMVTPIVIRQLVATQGASAQALESAGRIRRLAGRLGL